VTSDISAISTLPTIAVLLLEPVVVLGAFSRQTGSLEGAQTEPISKNNGNDSIFNWT
jgi:hypothetical protein